MSFMAGFGEGFSKTYGTAIAQKRENEAAKDRLKAEWDMRSAFERTKEAAEEKKIQAALIKSNRGFAKAFNMPDEVAIEFAAQGVDISKLSEKKLASMTYTKVGADTASSTNDPASVQTTEALGGPTSALTEARGNVTTPTATGGETSAGGPTIGGYRIGTMAGADAPTNETELYFSLAKQRNPGASQEQILADAVRIKAGVAQYSQAAKEGWKPTLVLGEDGKMTTKVLKPQTDVTTGETTYIEFNPDGSAKTTYAANQARTLTDYEDNLAKDILTQASSKEIQEAKMKIGEVASLSGIFSKADQIVTDTKEAVLATKVTGLAQIADSLVKNAVAGFGLFGEDASKLESLTPETVKEHEAELEKLSGSVTGLAEKAAIFKAQMALAVYKAGRLENQDGKDMTSVDMKSFAKIIDSSVSQDQFRENFANFIAGKTAELDAQTQGFAQYNAKIDELRRSTNGYSPVEKFAPTVEEYVNNSEDGNAKRGYALVQQVINGTDEKLPKGKQEQTTMAAPQAGTVEADPESGQKYRFKGGDPSDQNNWELAE